MQDSPPSKGILTQLEVQQRLNENDVIIQAIHQNQNIGKLMECSQYLYLLHQNLMELSKIADSEGISDLSLFELTPLAQQPKTDPSQIQSSSNASSKKYNSKPWTSDEQDRLALAVSNYGVSNSSNLSRFVVTRTAAEVEAFLASNPFPTNEVAPNMNSVDSTTQPMTTNLPQGLNAPQFGSPHILPSISQHHSSQYLSHNNLNNTEFYTPSNGMISISVPMDSSVQTNRQSSTISSQVNAQQANTNKTIAFTATGPSISISMVDEPTSNPSILLTPAASTIGSNQHFISNNIYNQSSISGGLPFIQESPNNMTVQQRSTSPNASRRASSSSLQPLSPMPAAGVTPAGMNQSYINMDKTTLFTPSNPPRPGSPRSPRTPKSPKPSTPVPTETSSQSTDPTNTESTSKTQSITINSSTPTQLLGSTPSGPAHP